MSASYRPQVSVINGDKQVTLPSVLVAPIRTDIVQFVHTQMRKINNKHGQEKLMLV